MNYVFRTNQHPNEFISSIQAEFGADVKIQPVKMDLLEDWGERLNIKVWKQYAIYLEGLSPSYYVIFARPRRRGASVRGAAASVISIEQIDERKFDINGSPQSFKRAMLRDFLRMPQVRGPVGHAAAKAFRGSSRDPIDMRLEKPLYRVWFGTNRMPVYRRTGKLSYFGVYRSDDLHYGFCDVLIPRSHKFGSIGSSLFRRVLTLTDDRLYIRKLESLEAASFWEMMSNDLKTSDSKAALVYIHGYNVGFKQAALRAAQIGFDLKNDGITAFFSWPSKANLFLYKHDENAVEASEAALTKFLCEMVTKSGATKIHIIAHSMGNRGFIRALQRIQANPEVNSIVKFGQIILAAPDMDTDVFTSLAHLYPLLAERTTLYVSPSDLALGASRYLGGYARAGLTPPVAIFPNIDTIKVPFFNLLSLGHGYYAEAEGMLYDVFALLNGAGAPSTRQRLRSESTEDGKSYWSIRA